MINIRNFAVCLGISVMASLFSCGNPVKPDEAPVLVNAVYPVYTGNTTVKGKLSYTGKAESAAVEVNNGAEQTVPINASDSTFDITVPLGDGQKTVRTRAKGPGGYSNADNDIVNLITTTPTADTIIIPRYTNSRNLRARVSAGNSDSMRVGENLTAGFVPYDTIADIILSLPEENKTVYAVFKNRLGSISDTLSATTNLDMTAPGFPAGFKDTTFNDNRLYLGNFQTGDLAAENYSMWGATTASGSLRNLDTLTLNEGLTYIMAFEQDSAGNVMRDTARITATRLDSVGLISRILKFYADSGHSPIDSSQQFTATDSLNRSFSARFNYSFDVGGVKHNIKACDSVPPDVNNAFDYTTRLNKSYGFANRFFLTGKEFVSELNRKILNSYNQNRL